MIARQELTHTIKIEARRLGFDLVGMTTPAPPAHWDVYANWLSNGHHAGMAWMDSERARLRRADPRLILPECESILVLGVCYPPPFSIPPEIGGETGGVAAYAQGQDYHNVLPPKLRALVTFIEEQVEHPIPNRYYTDTGPILERELAQRAGLGWIGKNTNLIHPQAGSYFLLAEILLGIKLEFDAPFANDHCGSCTRCLEACPTACILPNRTIDANRCISYLTIEEKGPIPIDLRPTLGDWIFGCDICQQVCPWNPPFGSAPFMGGRKGGGHLTDELALGPKEFNRKFRGTPIKRTKRRGYLRNVAVALGNVGGQSDVPALAQALGDQEPLVRAHAAWALGQIGGNAARTALTAALQVENIATVQAEIQQALTTLKDIDKTR